MIRQCPETTALSGRRLNFMRRQFGVPLSFIEASGAVAGALNCGELRLVLGCRHLLNCLVQKIPKFGNCCTPNCRLMKPTTVNPALRRFSL